ncbi:patatin-like phospholipase family protein [Candidatus Woesearchaeota archaeon]|nr:patatin-like phospholipase family protein [Candidatus Woesearchaeota archaeon]
MKRIGIAFGGGGARGIAHIAFLKVFDELGMRPSIISGTSIGAVIGAMYASGSSGQEIENIFKELTLAKMTKLADFTWRKRSGLIKGNKIVSFIGQHLNCKTFEELQIPLKLIAADFWKRTEVVFEKGNLVDAIHASIAIPGAFEPRITNEAVLIDGGFINPLPFEVIRDDCDILIAIDVSAEKEIESNCEKPTIFESILFTLHLMQKSILKEKLLHSKPDMLIKPNVKGIGTLDFNRTKEILAQVEADVDNFRKEILKRTIE